MNQLELDLQPPPEYRTIPLTQGQFAIIDAADFDWLNSWKWQAQWAPHVRSFYATRRIYSDGGSVSVSMQRMIAGTSTERHTDHINGNTLDNRRRNLRTCTRAQNQQNRKVRHDSSTGLKGVSKIEGLPRWRAKIHANGRRINLGNFDSPDLAYQAYAEAAQKYYGEFARI